jgi:naphthoate synthase
MSDSPFHAAAWSPVDGFADLTDITYHRHITEPTVRVAFNRPPLPLEESMPRRCRR